MAFRRLLSETADDTMTPYVIMYAGSLLITDVQCIILLFARNESNLQIWKYLLAHC